MNIQLSKSWRDSPDCWKNFFVSELGDPRTYIRKFGAPMAKINHKLKPWNAVLDDGPTYTIRFTTNEDKLIFLLRWS
jgi:hypothetical protein